MPHVGRTLFLLLFLGHFQTAAAEVQIVQGICPLGLLKDFSRQPIDNEATIAVTFHKSRRAQDSQVVRHRDNADVQLGREIADILGAISQGAHNAQPAGLAQRFETLGARLRLQWVFGCGHGEGP